jgi:ribosome-associated protein
MALEKKALDPVILDVGELVGYTDYMVVVSARNPRQVRAIAEGVRQALKQEHALLPVGVEGTESARWVLVDYDDVVLHVFLEEARNFYDVEGLWSDAQKLPLPEGAALAEPDFYAP